MIPSDRLFYPCIVHDGSQHETSISSTDVGFSFESYEKETLENINWISLAEKKNFNKPKHGKATVVEKQSKRASQAFSRDEGTTKDLTDETKLSFVLPPDVAYPLHIRYRENIDKKIGPWRNPLTFKDGSFFSPKLRISLPAGSDKANPHHSPEVLKIPPPVLLSKYWERNHIVNSYKSNVNGRENPVNHLKGGVNGHKESSNDAQDLRQRIYTISGLTPSVEKGGTWSSWLVGTASKGVYGVRTIQVQFASEIHDVADENGEISKISRSYFDLEESDWQLLQTLEYKVPSVDIFRYFLTNGLNWAKSTGVKQLEQSVMGELNQNRGRNSVIIKQFLEEVFTKLEPLWENQIVPYLEQDANLQFILREKRDHKMRELMFSVMKVLQKHKLVKSIPASFHSIKPEMVGIDLIAVTGHVKRLQKKKDRLRFQIHPGTTLKLRASARVSVEGSRKRLDVPQIEDQTPIGAEKQTPKEENLKIWFTIYNKKSERFLDPFDDAILVNAGDFIQGPARKIRQKAIDREGDLAIGEITLKGKDKYGNNLIESGSSLLVKVFVEQYGAHEDTLSEVKCKFKNEIEEAKKDEDKSLGNITENSSQSSDSELQKEEIVDDDFAKDKPVRRSNISVLSLPKSKQHLKDVLEELRLSDDYSNAKITDSSFLKHILERLGNNVSSFDLLEFRKLLKIQRKPKMTRDELDDLFIKEYLASKYNQSMVNEMFSQLNSTLRHKKIDFLKGVLKIPDEKLDEVKLSKQLFSFPEAKVLKKHGTGLVKSFVSDKYTSLKDEQIPVFSLQNEQKNENGTNQEEEGKSELQTESSTEVDIANKITNKVRKIDLEDKEALEKEKLGDVLATFVHDGLINAVGKRLPESCFQSKSYRTMFREGISMLDSDNGSSHNETLQALKLNSDRSNAAARREWIDSSVAKNESLAKTAKEAATWMVVGLFREYSLNKEKHKLDSRKAKEEAAIEAKKKTERVMKFITNASIENDSDASMNDEEELKIEDFFDVFSVVAKEVVKKEIEDVIKEMVPQVSKTISEKMIPAIASGIISGLKSLFWKNKIKIALSIATATTTIYCLRNPAFVSAKLHSLQTKN